MRLTGIDNEMYYAIMIGDIDDDGNLFFADAHNVLRISVGLDQPTRIAKIAADVDRDDYVTVSDAKLVLWGWKTPMPGKPVSLWHFFGLQQAEDTSPYGDS